ncbi:Gfo/Idh/MocA family protein [Dictyobacter aurantiacus]|uniref:Oxidoreductase n=1 Tax=Dictyobacter aurantiacus TaxID=1936993 RepID=A0A401ZLA4_9CHLR|nr:Gfo/Idh/MocA family oxidoreductase [Dictyobacter aurantiacus]GCE07661.1 oxidoreductase [Dictyobacter aurantiacus]
MSNDAIQGPPRGDWQVSSEIPLPRRRDYPIAIVGAGSIVNDAHLPAYRKAGFNVIGIYDQQTDKARATAARYGIDTVYASLDDVLASPAAIVDVAVPARENYAIATRVAQAGKALLLQKPMAEDLATAGSIVAAVEEAGIVAAVNQQARWMPAALAMRDLIRRGLLGEIYQVTFLINVLTPWDTWPWIVAGEHVEVMYHSIHYLDTIRALLGREPRLVFADGSTVPGFATGGETRTTIQLIFDGQLRATVVDTHHNSGGLVDQFATFRVEGTEGSAVAELGLLKNYPTGVPDSFRYMSHNLQSGTWISPDLAGSWFPDAFIGTMASVMRGLEGAPGAPETSLRDNLGTLRIVMAAYRSMTSHCAVDPQSL